MYRVRCDDGPIMGRWISVQGLVPNTHDGYLVLCEVEVFARPSQINASE